ncbi:unnamed protein product [Lasius platythorax]|uniref:Uncharacterized protein n=1 Tax=Lasius platythorax TaxID=488582 RepID=A0AAV2N4U2_9HYME
MSRLSKILTFRRILPNVVMEVWVWMGDKIMRGRRDVGPYKFYGVSRYPVGHNINPIVLSGLVPRKGTDA